MVSPVDHGECLREDFDSPQGMRLKPLGVPKSHPPFVGLWVLSWSAWPLTSGAQLAQDFSLGEKESILTFLTKF